MLTRIELAEVLRDMNVEDVAREAGVSIKTIYRIRTDEDYSPTMLTAERIVSAIRKVKLAAPSKVNA